MEERGGGRPLLLIDLAVPRDIDAACAELDGVSLYDIDDLQAVVDRNRRVRQAEARRGRGDHRGGDPAALRPGSVRSRCCRRWRRCAVTRPRSPSRWCERTTASGSRPRRGTWSGSTPSPVRSSTGCCTIRPLQMKADARRPRARAGWRLCGTCSVCRWRRRVGVRRAERPRGRDEIEARRRRRAAARAGSGEPPATASDERLAGAARAHGADAGRHARQRAGAGAGGWVVAAGRSRPRSSRSRSGGPGRGGAEDKSRWMSELERALLDGRIDIAVHSAKDVPTELAEGLELVAVPAAPTRATRSAARLRWRAASRGAGRDEQPAPGRPDPGRTRRPGGRRAARQRRHPAAQAARRGGPTRWCWRWPGWSDWAGSRGRRGHRRVRAGRRPGRAGARGTRRGGWTGGAGRVIDEVARHLRGGRADLVGALGASCHTPVGAHARPMRRRSGGAGGLGGLKQSVVVLSYLLAQLRVLRDLIFYHTGVKLMQPASGLKTVLAGLFCLTAGSLAGGPNPGGPKSEEVLPLATIEQVREITPEQADKHHPVHLRGVVTFY